MAKGIFSFLFKGTDTGAQTGSKKDGKGNAELISMGNTEAAKQVQLSKDKGNVKGKENDTPAEKVAKKEKRKYKSTAPIQANQTKNNRRRKEAKKVVRTRTLEINDKTRQARQEVKAAKKSTINQQAKVKAVKDFINQLPPETQDLVKEQIKQKVTPQKEKKIVLQKQQEKMSKRELLERKRGAYREKQTALRLAKLAAEKAREMVKAVRDRVLRKNKPQNAPVTNSNTKQKTQSKDKSLEVAKVKKAKETQSK